MGWFQQRRAVRLGRALRLERIKREIDRIERDQQEAWEGFLREQGEIDAELAEIEANMSAIRAGIDALAAERDA